MIIISQCSYSNLNPISDTGMYPMAIVCLYTQVINNRSFARILVVVLLVVVRCRCVIVMLKSSSVSMYIDIMCLHTNRTTCDIVICSNCVLCVCVCVYVCVCVCVIV